MKGTALAMVTFLLGVPSPSAGERPFVLPIPAPLDGAPVQAVIPPDAIRAIDAPAFVRGPAAAGQMALDEHVLGVRLAGIARAYPLGHLSSHEIVNDRFGDTPVAVTW
jgi:hypothetical protein